MLDRSVLIVSASTGTGHRHAGEAVRAAVQRRNPASRVEHVDLLDLAPGWVRSTYGGGYELMATRAPWLWGHVYEQTDGDGSDRARWSPVAHRLLFKEFQKLLGSQPWRVALCTHFLPCQLAAGRPGLPPFALAITDFTLHRYWVQPGVRHYFVATDHLAADLRSRVPGALVFPTGIPIAPTFIGAPHRLAARAQLGLALRRRNILVMGGGLGIGTAEMTRAVLAGAPEDALVVAICGRNEPAAAELEGLGLSEDRLRVERFVGNVTSFLAATDLLVTKPGGLTLSEALALGRPLLLTHAIPGQEVGNTRFLVAAGAALSAASDGDISGAVRSLMADDALLSGLASAARRLGRPDSADRLATIVDESFAFAHRSATFPSFAPRTVGTVSPMPRAG